MPVEGLRADLRAKYPKGTSTAQLMVDGLRTATTRRPFASVGDTFLVKGERFRVTAVEKVDLKTPAGRETWSKREGWDADYATKTFGSQVYHGATQTVFEKVVPAKTETKVQLPKTSPYTAKDQAKSDKANKFIGRGSPRSSTAAYAKAWGDRANTGKYTAEDRVFVSAEGNRTGRVAPDLDELGKATSAGATIVTDDAANRGREYNVGEREVAAFLSKQGYREVEPGVWAPGAKTEAPRFITREDKTAPTKEELYGEDKVTEFQGGHRFLSNFWPAEVTFGAKKYPSVEHAYQAAKTTDEAARERIRTAATAADAKRLGKSVSMRKDWNELKIRTMEGLVRQKFQDPALRAKLLATGEAELQEGNRWNDKFWGVDLRTGEGRNELGKILMKVRAELSQGKVNLSMHYDPATARQVGATEQAAAIAEAQRILGPKLKIAFRKLASGIAGVTWTNPAKGDAISINEILPAAVSANEVAWHESMHAIFSRLTGEKSIRQARELLLEVANSPLMLRRLNDALAGFPEAQQQAKTDREEALAYMYQLWAAGKINVVPRAEGAFQKVAQFLRRIAGIVTKYEKAEALMASIHKGEFADPRTIGPVLKMLGKETFREKADRLAPPLARLGDRVFSGATDRLRQTALPAFQEMADMWHKEPDREGGGNGTIQRTFQKYAQFLNRAKDVVTEYTPVQQALALEGLQSGTPPAEAGALALHGKLRGLMDNAYNYMTERGVLTIKRKADGSAVMRGGKPVWEPVPRRPDYFPQVWDKEAIGAKEAEFIDALMTKGTKPRTAAQARAVLDAIVAGSGQLQLAETEHDLGFSPFMPHVNQRTVTFDPANAQYFTPFMSKDLMTTLATYMRQATHRAEYTKDWINPDGSSKIEEYMDRAKKEGATAEELAEARRTIRALEGTLGHEMSPGLRDVFSHLIVYQNMILLPFALFSSLPDPLGMGLRSHDMSEAFGALKKGLKGVWKDLKGDKTIDAEEELAKTLGLISDANMIENMGVLANGSYMSKNVKRWNDAFFRWNGMEGWNRRMRIAAMGAGQRFMLRHSKRPNDETSQRFMKELGLEDMSQWIKEMPDGRMALTKEDFKALGGKMPGREELARLHEAMFRFVDGGVLRPNAAHRAVWASDPHWMLVAHLKQYTYSFQNTINRFVAKEVEHGNQAALVNLTAYVPWMLAVDVLQGGLTASGAKASWGMGDYIASALERSSILGNYNFGVQAIEDAGRGQVPGASFLGPTANHAGTLIKWMAGDPATDAGRVLMRSLPGSKVVASVLE